jgi:hypothetical protein
MTPCRSNRTDTPTEYAAWLASLKARIREARVRASLAVNSELIGLYRESMQKRGVPHAVAARQTSL